MESAVSMIRLQDHNLDTLRTIVGQAFQLYYALSFRELNLNILCGAYTIHKKYPGLLKIS